MADEKTEEPDKNPTDLSRTLTDLANLADRVRRFVDAYMARRKGDDIRIPDPPVVAKTFLGLARCRRLAFQAFDGRTGDF